MVGPLGDVWKLTVHNDAVAYDASSFGQQPNFGPYNQVDAARALPQVAINVHWPFMRDAGGWGTQVIEPIAELIVAPQTGNSQVNKYPNEDSLDLRVQRRQPVRLQPLPRDRPAGGRRAR